jgi:hypothetical protein
VSEDDANVLRFPGKLSLTSRLHLVSRAANRMRKRQHVMIVCKLVELALERSKELLRKDMELDVDVGATPLLLDIIDNLDAAQQKLLRGVSSGTLK